MKIRNGFVSNSSTSSFCIYGVAVCDLDLTKFTEDLDLDNDVGVTEALEEAGERLGLEYRYGSGEPYIGRSWKSVGDDETGAAFKADVEAKLCEITGAAKVECATHQEAWYDG